MFQSVTQVPKLWVECLSRLLTSNSNNFYCRVGVTLVTYLDHFVSRCMLNTIDGPSEQVEDYLCDPEEMPLGARNSRLPCPEDCVLSDWGAWSPCPLVRMTHFLLCHCPSPPHSQCQCRSSVIQVMNPGLLDLDVVP